MVLALSLGSPESPRPCFIPLAVKGFFLWLPRYESPWRMSVFSAITDVNIDSPERGTTLWESWALGRIRVVFYFATRCFANTHSSFFFPSVQPEISVLFSLNNLCKYNFPSFISSTQHQGKPGYIHSGIWTLQKQREKKVTHEPYLWLCSSGLLWKQGTYFL